MTISIFKKKNIAPTVAWASKKVLVVEDDRTHRTLMKNILEECGIAVETAENGVIALSRVQNADPLYDLILMDVDMPTLDGIGTVRTLRAWQGEGRVPYIPVVAFTASRSAEDRERCLAAGMDAHLSKDVWLPHWRKTLIDNLLQGMITDPSAHEKQEEEDPGHANTVAMEFNPDLFDERALDHTISLLKNEFPIAVEEYLEDAASYIRQIQEGIQIGDAEKTARGSHPLKSNSKGFGLIAVSRLAENINLLSRAHDLETAKSYVPQLRVAFDKAEKKLREEILKRA